jgi:site-specific recombinase XerD
MPTPIFEAFEIHLRGRPEGVSPYTVRGYVRDLKKFAGWFEKTNGEAMRLRDVTPVDVRDYKAHLQAVKKYKPSTINRRLAALRAYFSWAINEGMISEDPVRVRNVEEPQTAPRSISEREYHRLLRAVQKDGGKRDIAIVQMLRHSGLRVGELCDLALEDVEISKRKGKVIVRSGKGRRYREVPLNLDARRALQEYLSSERLETDDPHIFIGQRGNGLTESAIQDIVRKYSGLAKLEGVTPHVLRHTFAKSLIDKGVDLVTVKHLMGHKRLDSTARYTKPSKRDLEVAVSRLELEEL